MSQVKRYATGTGEGGLQPTTLTPAVSSTPKLTFKVDGNEYKLDEQAVRDKFNTVFTDLVQKGEAHERDRDKWISANEQVLGNMRKGVYELNSSNGQLYNGAYEGEATNASLGKNDDGTSARKSGFGNFISRASKSDAQRVNMLNGYLGNAIIGSYSQSQADAKKKAQEQLDKDNKLGEDNALSFGKKLKASFGESAYGKDFLDDQNLVLSKWFDDKSTAPSARYSAIYNNLSDKYKSLFDPQWDKYKDVLKSKGGIDLDDLRQKATGVGYDPTTGKFKGKYAKITDLLPLTNPFDTMHNDNIFMDKAAYLKSLQTTAATGGGAGGLGTDDNNKPKPLTQTGDYWSDGIHFWKDKDRKALQTGFDKDNRLFGEDGTPYRGWYLHQNDPDSKYTGWYDSGARKSITDGKNYMTALGKQPVNEAKVKEYQKQYSQIIGAYDNVLNSKDWLNGGEAPNDDATYNIWSANQKGGTMPAKVMDITSKYIGLNGRANIQAYTTQRLNEYGRPHIYHLITLANHKQYKGIIRRDPLNGVTDMVDENGQPINDPNLTAALRGVKYNPAGQLTNPGNTTFSGASTNTAETKDSKNLRAATLQGGFPGLKEGGVIPTHQSGGTFGISDLLQGSTGQGAKPQQHEATVSDIGKSINDPGFHLSGADKAELVALGANLGSLGVAIGGGGGGGVSAGLGAVGTLTQLGADFSKHGFNLGDLGSAALGLGLDAAAILPGLGVLSEGAKVTKTLAKTAKFLVPALTAAGLYSASGVVMDIASGKKSIKDLNIQDLKALSHGLGAVVGGTRAITQRVGTEQGSVSSVKLKDGTQVQLDEAGLNAIKGATDKSAAIKSVVSRLTGNNGEVELADKFKLGKTGWNPLKGWSTSTENTGLVNTSTGRVPRNVDDIQGNSLWSKYQRFAATKAATRDLNSPRAEYAIDPKYKINASGDIDQTTSGIKNQSLWSLTGDYWKQPSANTLKAAKDAEGTDFGSAVGSRRELSGDYTTSKPQSTYEYEAGKTATVGDVPDTRRIYGSMFGMRSLDNERAVSYNEVRNRVRGLSGTKSSREQLNKFLKQDFEEGSFSKNIQSQIKEALTSDTIKGYVKFKEGGVVKAQTGGTTNWINPLNTSALWPTPNLDPQTPTPMQVPTKLPYQSYENPFNSQWGAIQFDANGAPKMVAQPKALGKSPIKFTNPGKGFNLHLPKFNIDPTTLSELGRALYTSNLNKSVDTRVERPMLTAPLEIPTTVRGNLYAQNVANTQADNIVRNSQQFKTSDGSLQMLGNLEAERQAGQLRVQGAMQNNQAMEQSRLQAQQSAMQNAQNRSNVANENIQTNARATQAERGAANEKRREVNQPLLDFWKDQNYKSYIQQQQNRAIDTQIGGLGEEAKTRGIQQQIMADYNKLYSDQTIAPEARVQQESILNRKLSNLQNAQTLNMLRIRKDPYAYRGWTTQQYTDATNAIPVQKDGGTVKLQQEVIKQNATTSRDIAKEHNDFIQDGLEEQTKKQIAAMKEIGDMIKMALK